MEDPTGIYIISDSNMHLKERSFFFVYIFLRFNLNAEILKKKKTVENNGEVTPVQYLTIQRSEF